VIKQQSEIYTNLQNFLDLTKKEQALHLLEILKENPFQTTPRFEKLTGDLTGAYSRRINVQQKFVYQILAEENTVKIIRMWTHYE